MKISFVVLSELFKYAFGSAAAAAAALVQICFLRVKSIALVEFRAENKTKTKIPKVSESLPKTVTSLISKSELLTFLLSFFSTIFSLNKKRFRLKFAPLLVKKFSKMENFQKLMI